MKWLKLFFQALLRRKPIDIDLGESKLKRCLTTLDLTALGVGSTLGLGIYVLAGQVAGQKAGPAVTLSFFVAAVASIFAGLCYAEFGARVPKAGSAYVYSYVTVGEFMAFIIGWNLLLEYIIGTASVARGYSGYVDSIFNGTIERHLREVMPINIQDVSAYPDFVALGITLLLTVMLAIGVKESSRFNNIFTGLNLLVVIFVIVAGSIKSDIHNWNLNVTNLHNVTTDVGDGGFFPFGVSGMLSGAATCFYGFIGFDCIATTGEEVKNPQKAIPISIVVSLLIVFLAYFGVSAVQTLMVPYYLQIKAAPLPFVFAKVGWSWASWLITIGALAGLATSLLGAMFPLPRVMYAMASDGVIFRVFSKVHPRLKTPLIATIFAGCFAGVMSMFFDVRELADMMSIGTLLAYTLVAISVLILRYRENISATTVIHNFSAGYNVISQDSEKCDVLEQNGISPNQNGPLGLPVENLCKCNIFRLLFNLDRYKAPTKETAQVSMILIWTICIFIIALDAVLAFDASDLSIHNFSVTFVTAVIVFCIILFLLLLYRQPVEDSKMSFKVPLVPFIPVFSIFVNVFLMFKLSVLTWKRFGIWMAIGFFIYFTYGLWHSSERTPASSHHLARSPNHIEDLVDKQETIAINQSMPGSPMSEPSSSSLLEKQSSSKF